MKMQKTDIGVVVFMYAVCGFFYAYSSKLSDSSRTYPKFTIALLFFLTSFYLVQMILNARRFGVESGVDTVFAGFKPVQFIVSVALILVYFGCFVSTTVFMLACLLFLRVPILATVISIVSIDLLIYLAFVLFLGVRLPAGILF